MTIYAHVIFILDPAHLPDSRSGGPHVPDAWCSSLQSPPLTWGPSVLYSRRMRGIFHSKLIVKSLVTWNHSQSHVLRVIPRPASPPPAPLPDPRCAGRGSLVSGSAVLCISRHVFPPHSPVWYGARVWMIATLVFFLKPTNHNTYDHCDLDTFFRERTVEEEGSCSCRPRPHAVLSIFRTSRNYIHCNAFGLSGMILIVRGGCRAWCSIHLRTRECCYIMFLCVWPTFKIWELMISAQLKRNIFHHSTSL